MDGAAVAATVGLAVAPGRGVTLATGTVRRGADALGGIDWLAEADVVGDGVVATAGPAGWNIVIAKTRPARMMAIIATSDAITRR